MKKLFILLVAVVFASPQLFSQMLDFDYEPEEFGQGRSIGLSLLGDGIIGMTFKFVQDNQNQIEINPAYTGRAEVFTVNDEIIWGDYYHGIAVTGGYNLFTGSNYKSRKRKVIKNYVGLKGGLMYRGEPELITGVVWHREAFRSHENNYSRGLDLGLRYTKILGNGVYVDSDYGTFQDEVTIYLKVDWNWFRQ